VANLLDRILADEPTAALDRTIRAQNLRVHAGVVETRGIAVLLILHDLGVVSRACRVHPRYPRAAEVCRQTASAPVPFESGQPVSCHLFPAT
jgi:ABC-type oligopeptide transport system ATPase subunit